MTFPLISIPKRVVYVDDKGSFLEVLRKTMPRHHAREFISSPLDAVERLSMEGMYWRDLERLLSVAETEGNERTGFATRLIESYFGNWSRFHLTSVLIVDYAMPGLSGLELIKKLSAWPGRRILLTGEADAQVAISAFNAGLIQKFIPKSTPNLYRALTSGYEEMHQTVCEHLGHLIRPTLTPEQRDILHRPAVVEGLRQKVEDLDWSEYVLIARPFGLLGMRHDGPLQWLQLETRESLGSLAEILTADGFAQLDIRQVQDGHFLANAELHQELALPGQPQLADAELIAEGPDLYAAVFDLANLPVLSSKVYGIDDIMSPMEEMRSLVRDLVVEHQRGVDDGELDVAMDDGDEDLSRPGSDAVLSPPTSRPAHDVTGFDAVLQRLATTVAQSEMHRHALTLVLAERSVPPAVNAYVQAVLAVQQAK